jgi:hypothetical protein
VVLALPADRYQMITLLRTDHHYPFSSVLTLAEHSAKFSRGANDGGRIRSSRVRRRVPSKQGRQWFLS